MWRWGKKSSLKKDSEKKVIDNAKKMTIKMMIIDDEDKVYEYEKTCNANTYIFVQKFGGRRENPSRNEY